MFRIRHILHRTTFNTNTPFRTSTLRSHVSAHNLPLELPLQSGMRWSYLWYTSILALGITTGLAAGHFFAPPGLLPPGSQEDRSILQSLSQDIDNLDIVKKLRKESFNLHSDASVVPSASRGSRKIWGKGWVELDIDPSKELETSTGKGLLGAMSGTRGLGVQRAFWNEETREMAAVVWLGGGLAGWPGVAHGGAIATIFEEAMARTVSGPVGHVGMYNQTKQFTLRSRAQDCYGKVKLTTFPAEPQHRPTTLSVTYVKPTYTLDFYILRASFSKPESPQDEPLPDVEAEPAKSWLGRLSPQKDLTKVEPKTRHTAEVIGTLESVKGELCVKAKGTFAMNGIGE